MRPAPSKHGCMQREEESIEDGQLLWHKYNWLDGDLSKIPRNGLHSINKVGCFGDRLLTPIDS